MYVTFSRILILCLIVHLSMMAIKVRDKMTVELNIAPPKEMAPIKIKFVDPAPEAEDNTAFEFVETDVVGVEEEVDTKYMSDKTTKVEKETVSHQNKGGGSDGADGSKDESQSKPVTQMPPSSSTTPPEKVSPTGKKKELSLNDLKPDLKEFNPPKNAPVAPSDGRTGKAKDSPLNGPGSNFPVFDEDVAEGDQTSLNTIEFKYASFYKRMKEQVGNTWIPIVTRMSPESLDPGIYRTRVILKINHDGEIIGLKLDGESGVIVLDEIAMSTFTKVRIFPNPPLDLFNGKEYLYIPWTLELRN